MPPPNAPKLAEPLTAGCPLGEAEGVTIGGGVLTLAVLGVVSAGKLAVFAGWPMPSIK